MLPSVRASKTHAFRVRVTHFGPFWTKDKILYIFFYSSFRILRRSSAAQFGHFLNCIGYGGWSNTPKNASKLKSHEKRAKKSWSLCLVCLFVKILSEISARLSLISWPLQSASRSGWSSLNWCLTVRPGTIDLLVHFSADRSVIDWTKFKNSHHFIKGIIVTFFVLPSTWLFQKRLDGCMPKDQMGLA